MPRHPAFRVAILIVPIVLAALPARAAGRAAHAIATPGHPAASSPPDGSAGLRIEHPSEATGQALDTRSPGVHRVPLHRFPRFSTRRTPSLSAPLPAASPTERITISVNRPMHLCDFLLQTHSAFHLATRIGPGPTDSSPPRTCLGWTSLGPVPMT